MDSALKALLDDGKSSTEKLVKALDSDPELLNGKLPLEKSLTTGDTLLERAVMEAKEEKAILIVDKGANLDTTFEGGRNILHVATETLNMICKGMWSDNAQSGKITSGDSLNMALERFGKVVKLHGIITAIAERAPRLLSHKDENDRRPEDVIDIPSGIDAMDSGLMQTSIATSVALLKGEMTRLRLQHESHHA